MHQLKYSYNSPFKDSCSNPIHTYFAMIASSGGKFVMNSWNISSRKKQTNLERCTLCTKHKTIVYNNVNIDRYVNLPIKPSTERWNNPDFTFACIFLHSFREWFSPVLISSVCETPTSTMSSVFNQFFLFNYPRGNNILM